MLIVDDHPGFRTTARALLESDGFSVVGEASDGDEAVALSASLHPDVVLLDIQLADEDGFQVAGRLEELNGNSPAIVLVSSRDATDFGGLIDGCGARGFVAKGDLSGAAVRALLR